MNYKPLIIITGGAGFIGSNFIKKICCDKRNINEYNFMILDALTYAGYYPTIENELKEYPHLQFIKIDLRNLNHLKEIFSNIKNEIRGIIHFAAESHVDRSIEEPSLFVETNVLGTLNLLKMALNVYQKNKTPLFRYLQVSTDEVYGHLHNDDPAFMEETPLMPNSPYSASKASADLLVRSYFQTFKLPTLITRCSNNYGPYQFPEKFIPLMIHQASQNKPLPIYGQGENIRDWIHVDDHNEGVWTVFNRGKPGETYNLGGDSERKNIEVAKVILQYFQKSESLIKFVPDRLGHDFRYAINFTKAKKDLDWIPKIKFEDGLEQTITWYKNNQGWVESVKKREKEFFFNTIKE